MSQSLRGDVVRGEVVGATLDVGEYVALWRHLRLERRPLLLDVPDHGAIFAERDVLDAAAWRRLDARGLLDVHGSPAPALADALVALAAPAVQVDARVVVEGREPHGVVAVSRAELGLVAVRGADGGVRLDPADPRDLAGALLGKLPDRRSAQGTPMVLPTDALAAAGTATTDRVRALRRAGVAAHVADRFAAMCARPPERVTQLGVIVRDPLGRAVRGPRILAVVDTVLGRFLLEQDPARPRMTFRPVERARLRRALAGVLDEHVRAVASRR